MGFSALPPEVNSTRMYSGPGSGPLVAAATAWDRLASQLRATAATCSSALATLTSEGWQGPASMAMTSTIAPYVGWLTATAAQAEQTAMQARVAANAYNQAFAMTVPPSTVAINRSQLTTLAATNVLGQNTPAIAANEAHYGEMWAQDATAMESYSAMSAAASALPPFTGPAQSGSAEDGLVDDDTAGTFLGLTAIRTALAFIRTIALDEIAVVSSLSGLGSFLVADTMLTRTIAKEDFGPGASRPGGVTLVSGGEEGGAVMGRPGGAAGVGRGPVSATMGRAYPVSALSVPQSWSTPPEIRQLVRSLPLTSAGAAPAAQSGDGEGSYAGLGMAGMAGGGMGGLAGLGAASASTTSQSPTTPNVAAQKAPKPAASNTAPPASAVTLPPDNVAESLAKTLAAMPGATVVVIPPATTSQ